MNTQRLLRTAGLTILSALAVVGLGTLLVRDQMSRHRRDLFSPHPLRRLAALGYLSGRPASVDDVLLVRDYVAWEQRPLLRRRAALLLARMETALAARVAPTEVA